MHGFLEVQMVFIGQMKILIETCQLLLLFFP